VPLGLPEFWSENLEGPDIPDGTFESSQTARNRPNPPQDWVLGYSQRSRSAKGILPGGETWPPLVRGCIQHVDTPGVHMLGHLEDLIELVVQGRFTSRSRQRVVTSSKDNLACIHNEYLYT
jgi:hypothetical protein